MPPRRAAVVVDDLSKTFRLPHRHVLDAQGAGAAPVQLAHVRRAARGRRRLGRRSRAGEFFGIVGRNGSGKSTLLKCLAGIYQPDDGDDRDRRPAVAVHRARRRLQPGPDRARQRDHQRDHARPLAPRGARRFDEIIAFAELEEFLDLKLKNYSSGMSVRLAFSVAIQVDADVLLVDEVLAVGDAAFQQKCFEQFHRLKAAGKTIVFVTHDMGAVERFCDRAMLIERGEIIALGEPHAIARAYNELNFGRLVHDDVETRPLRRPGGVRDRGRVVRDAAASAITAIAQGEPLDDRACEVALPRADRATRSSPSRCATRSATRSSPPRRHWRGIDDRQLRGRRDRRGPRRAGHLARARAATSSRRRSRATAAAPTRSTCARTSPSLLVHGTQHHGRRRRHPAHARRCERR